MPTVVACAPQQSATMNFMQKPFLRLGAFVILAFAPIVSPAQSSPGSLDFSARISPTAARPEPVRQFSFYVLTKSYGEVVREVEAQHAMPSREAFIESLKLSPELKEWLKEHDVLDLTLPGLDRLVSADDIIRVPEFLAAYQRSNSGGVTAGLPKPRFNEAEKTTHPERYNKQVQDYYAALKKFIQGNPSTLNGIELELFEVNPQQRWAQIQADHRRSVTRLAPEVAQTRYLAAKADTDLEGHASISGLAPGEYWISTLNLEANAGDMKLAWDVPVAVRAGQTTRVELTNINASDPRSAAR